MATDPRIELVPLVDAARERGDTAEVERLEAEVVALNKKLGKRRISGKLQLVLPKLNFKIGAKMQRFSDWANPLRSQ